MQIAQFNVYVTTNIIFLITVTIKKSSANSRIKNSHTFISKFG